MIQVTQKVALLLALLFTGVFQTQAAPDMIKTELLSLSFGGLVPGYYYKNGKEISLLTASNKGISPPVYYVGSPQLKLYEKKEDLYPVKEGEQPPKPILSVTIPTGCDRALLVFAFNKKNTKLPLLKSYGITDSNFKEGDYRIFNFSMKDVYVLLKDKKSAIAVAPGKQGDVRSGSWGKKIQSIQATFGAKNGKKIKRVYTSVWGHRPERRSFIFVFDKPDKMRPLTIRKFYDVPSFKAPKPKPTVAPVE